MSSTFISLSIVVFLGTKVATKAATNEGEALFLIADYFETCLYKKTLPCTLKKYFEINITLAQ